MTTHKERLVPWKKPNWGFLKMNTYGSSLGNLRRIGFGRLIQDEHGKWIVGFFGFLGTSTIMHAKLAAIYQGLKVATGFGLC